MGYHTDFQGKFNLDRPLSAEHAAYLKAFAGTRRMKRDAKKVALLPDPVRQAVGLPVEKEGGYFVGITEDYGQKMTPDILDYNRAPQGQCSLWCQWVPTDDLMGIEWDGAEKFYEYTPWLKYIIEHFLKPWGYVLNGEVEWDGEERGDVGTIHVTDNKVLKVAGL